MVGKGEMQVFVGDRQAFVGAADPRRIDAAAFDVGVGVAVIEAADTWQRRRCLEAGDAGQPPLPHRLAASEPVLGARQWLAFAGIRFADDAEAGTAIGVFEDFVPPFTGGRAGDGGLPRELLRRTPGQVVATGNAAEDQAVAPLRDTQSSMLRSRRRNPLGAAVVVDFIASARMSGMPDEIGTGGYRQCPRGCRRFGTGLALDHAGNVVVESETSGDDRPAAGPAEAEFATAAEAQAPGIGETRFNAAAQRASRRRTTIDEDFRKRVAAEKPNAHAGLVGWRRLRQATGQPGGRLLDDLRAAAAAAQPHRRAVHQPAGEAADSPALAVVPAPGLDAHAVAQMREQRASTRFETDTLQRRHRRPAMIAVDRRQRGEQRSDGDFGRRLQSVEVEQPRGCPRRLACPPGTPFRRRHANAPGHEIEATRFGQRFVAADAFSRRAAIGFLGRIAPAAAVVGDVARTGTQVGVHENFPQAAERRAGRHGHRLAAVGRNAYCGGGFRITENEFHRGPGSCLGGSQ